MTAKAIVGFGAAVVAVIGLLVARGLDSKPAPPAPATSSAPVRHTLIQYRGLALQIRSGYQPLEHYVPLLREIRDSGANTVMLCVAGYMEHAESQTIFLEARKLPSPQELKTIIQEARKLDLKVIVMPIILLSKPRGSEWRGVIKPPDWSDWWKQYREFIIYFCGIAREGGANALIVGSELVSTEKRTAEWVRIIETAREHFYDGQLGYSANWDHYKPVKFWDKLDFLGMTSYYTLADKKNPSVDEIVAFWQPIQKDISAWQQEIGKPIIFTEVGWCSQEGAAKAPWNYYQNQNATPAGHEEQRRLYEAFLRVWDDSPIVDGMIWWEWSRDPGGETDFGYTPRDKPAEHELRDWFARCNTAEAPTQASTTQPAIRDTTEDASPASSP
ncbi:MAG: hypothetical protein ABIG44_01925 [Planctomycetota bacterium]